MPTFATTKAGYASLWAKSKVKADRRGEAGNVATRIIINRHRYEAVEAKTGVPWFWVGAIHEREAGGDFRGVLHDGEHIIGTGRKTVDVPAGRGPFATWEEAAVDALEIKGLHRVDDWPIARMLYEAERYNGWGYVNKGVNSPYVWAATNLQQPGKYIRDHVWSSTANDSQLGVAAVLHMLVENDADIAEHINGTAKVPAAPVDARPSPPLPVPNPAPAPSTPTPVPTTPPTAPTPTALDACMAQIDAAVRTIIQESIMADQATLEAKVDKMADALALVAQALAKQQAAAGPAPASATSAAGGVDLGKIISAIPWAKISIAGASAAGVANSLGAIDWSTLLPILISLGGLFGISVSGPLGAVIKAVLPIAQLVVANAPKIQAAIDAQHAAATARDAVQARPENLGVASAP